MSGFSSAPPGPNVYPNNQYPNNQRQPGAQVPLGPNAAYNYAAQPHGAYK